MTPRCRWGLVGLPACRAGTRGTRWWCSACAPFLDPRPTRVIPPGVQHGKANCPGPECPSWGLPGPHREARVIPPGEPATVGGIPRAEWDERMRIERALGALPDDETTRVTPPGQGHAPESEADR